MSKQINTRQYRKQGFTIVEFMIATMVFSIILMVVTAAILHMTRMYQRSLYASATQAATRNLIDTVAQSIQFSSTEVTEVTYDDGSKGYCVGGRAFYYRLGKQLGSSNSSTGTDMAAVTYTNPVDSGCPTGPFLETYFIDGTKRELLSKNMRLANLYVTKVSGSLYSITARVVYGDDDLLCRTDVAGSCESSNVMSDENLMKPDIICKATTGSQYCSVSELTTTVTRRL